MTMWRLRLKVPLEEHPARNVMVIAAMAAVATFFFIVKLFLSTVLKWMRIAVADPMIVSYYNMDL